jgi:type IV pilus assembly protein PilY1
MSAQSAVAASSTSLNSGSVVYLASYTSSDWHGVLGAYALSTTGTIATTPTWSTNNAATFASATTRSLITSNTASTTAAPSVASGIAFSSSSATFNTMWGAVAGANANNLSWLRGDATQEMRNGGAYRNRATSVLGDIVDSAPVFAWHENFGYSILPEGGNYLTFISGKGNTPGSIYSGQGMVYVGANDGMLHGFDASTGLEVFGYVPHNVIPNLPALADLAYAHRFYVDQTPYVGDACVGSGPTSCSWKSILVGTTGAGGQGVFALDVTNPASMESTGSASSNVLWDLDGKGDLSTNPTNPNGDPDLGYPIGKPIIARLNNGDWSAIFGNGYLSARGCAVLFIVRLSDGTVTKLDTSGLSSTSTCTATNSNAGNGLGPVTLLDVNGDMTTDFVYAGDLQGNLWKFDLSSTSSGSWTVAFGGQPLFTASPGGGSCVLPATSTAANTCQPITSAPVLGPPLTGMSGTMVYFGTGRMFANGDAGTTSTQSFYGVLDKGGSSPVSGGQGALVAQTITDAGTTRTIGFNAVTSPKLGWFMNLPDTGERVTMSPILVNGYVLFATQIPSSNTCTASGSGWIMAVKASTNTTGGFDTPNFFYGQSGVSGVQSTVGVIQGITVLSDSANKQDRFLAGGTKGVQSFASSTGAPKGRMSWHELVR